MAFNAHSHIKGQEANTSVFFPHGKSASLNDDTSVIQQHYQLLIQASILYNPSQSIY